MTQIDTGTNELLCEISSRVAVVTLNKPHRKNALGDVLTPALRALLPQLERRADVGCVMITGAGNAFCSGGDVSEMGASAELGAPLVVFDHSVPRLPDVERWCAAQGVPWFDFTFTAEEWQHPITNSLADAHANRLGNRWLADKALASLRASGHIAPPASEPTR